MCFKKPKMPGKSAEELAAEAELKEQRAATKAELNAQISKDKKRATEEAVSRSRGAWGMRSLISGTKGGAGFSLIGRQMGG
jgi:hypothetical protein